MWVRKRLDIRWSELASALRDCLLCWERDARGEDLEELWSAGDAFACLSVRSGFDLWLKALQLPPGSEVLVSAITIRDMVRIIEAHNLVPVPVDLNPEDLSVDIASLNRAISPKTRAILVAHLFGTRQPMKPILEVARKHGLFVAEDCAQAFAGRHFTGDPGADVTMFSFGSIKTATALGGGLLCVRDADVLSRMRELQSTYPIQSRGLREKDRQARADEAHVVRPAIWRLGGGNAIDREGSRSICRLDRSRFSWPAVAAAHSPAALRAAVGDPASPHRVF